MDGPNLNAVTREAHRELADVWLTVDRDPETKVALLCGEERASSPRAGARHDRGPDHDCAFRTKMMREARDIVLRSPPGTRSGASCRREVDGGATRPPDAHFRTRLIDQSC